MWASLGGEGYVSLGVSFLDLLFGFPSLRPRLMRTSIKVPDLVEPVNIDKCFLFHSTGGPHHVSFVARAGDITLYSSL